MLSLIFPGSALDERGPVENGRHGVDRKDRHGGYLAPEYARGEERRKPEAGGGIGAMRRGAHAVDVAFEDVAGGADAQAPRKEGQAERREDSDQIPHRRGVRQQGGLRLSGWGYNGTQLQQRKEHV